MEVDNEKCTICGRPIYEYDKNWECKDKHDWRKSWRKDKSSEKYKKFLEKRNQAMKKSWRKRLDKLNKKPPSEYASRRGSKVLDNLTVIKRRRSQYRKIVERDIKI